MVFLLGAKDPEMDIIEVILKELNINYEYASVQGERCQAYNVYKADNSIADTEVVCVECMSDNVSGRIILLDHHNQDDVGYNLKFDQYVEASSIGQVLRYLFLNKEFSFKLKNVLETDLGFSEDYSVGTFFFQNDKWLIQGHNNFALVIPKEVLMIASSDHCLKDAYLGLCLGFSKEELLDHRIRILSKNTRYPFEEVQGFINNFMEKIKKYNDVIADLTYKDIEGNYSSKYLFIREASLILNKPIAIKVKEKGFEKLMLLGLEDFHVKDFLSKSNFKGFKLKNTFGVPSRGYAGGHVV